MFVHRDTLASQIARLIGRLSAIRRIPAGRVIASLRFLRVPGRASGVARERGRWPSPPSQFRRLRAACVAIPLTRPRSEADVAPNRIAYHQARAPDAIATVAKSIEQLRSSFPTHHELQEIGQRAYAPAGLLQAGLLIDPITCAIALSRVWLPQITVPRDRAVQSLLQPSPPAILRARAGLSSRHWPSISRSNSSLGSRASNAPRALVTRRARSGDETPGQGIRYPFASKPASPRPPRAPGAVANQDDCGDAEDTGTQSITSGHGSLYVDGSVLSRWIIDQLDRQAALPRSGVTAIDPRMTPSLG